MAFFGGIDYFKSGNYRNKEQIHNSSGNATDAIFSNESYYYESGDARSIMKMIQDEERRKMYSTNVHTTIFLIIIAVFGALGNGLVIYAFSRHLKKGTTNFFILLLAVIDLFNCTVIIPLTLYQDIWWQTTNDIMCKFLLSLKSTFVMFSPMILVVIAIDRCLQICFVPGIQIRLRTASFVIGVLFLYAVAISLPAGLRTGTVLKVTSGKTVQIYDQTTCHTDDRFISNEHFYIYKITQTAAVFLMLLILIVLYTIIFFFICSRHRRWNNRYKRQAGRTTNATEDGFMRAARGSRIDKASVSSLLGCPATTAIDVDCDSPDSGNGCRLPQEQGEFVNNNTSSNHWSADQEALELEPITPDEMETKMPFNQGETATNDIEICIVFTNNETNVNTPSTQAKHSEGTEQVLKYQKSRNAKETIQRMWKRVLRRRRTIEEQKHKKKKPHIKTAQTLAVVTAAFIISFLPYQLMTLQFIMKDMESSLEKNILFHFYFINSAVNPIIYSCMNRMFRSEIKKLCRRK